MGYVKQNAVAGREFASWEAFVAHLARWTREVADVRIHGTTGEPPLLRFQRDEAKALSPLARKPSFLTERELVRTVHTDCCVEVEANWYSAPQELIRQRVSVLVADQQVLIRYGGRIVARHERLPAGSRCRRVIEGHWEGLVPRKQRRQAAASLEPATHPGRKAGSGVGRTVLGSELARSLSVYAEIVGEVAA